jgi:hypothetical protein
VISNVEAFLVRNAFVEFKITAKDPEIECPAVTGNAVMLVRFVPTSMVEAHSVSSNPTNVPSQSESAFVICNSNALSGTHLVTTALHK